MANEITKCEHAINGHSRPFECTLTHKMCICQRWCVHDSCYKHSDVSHCKDYTPRQK